MLSVNVSKERCLVGRSVKRQRQALTLSQNASNFACCGSEMSTVTCHVSVSHREHQQSAYQKDLFHGARQSFHAVMNSSRYF